MSNTPTTNTEKLEQAYAGVSDTYRGLTNDLYGACREKRRTTRVYEGDYIAKFLGVPTNAGQQAGTKPTYAVFQYQDVIFPSMALLVACDYLEVPIQAVEVWPGRFVRLPNLKVRPQAITSLAQITIGSVPT